MPAGKRSSRKLALFCAVLFVIMFWQCLGRDDPDVSSAAGSDEVRTVDRAQSLAVDAAGSVYVTGYSYNTNTDYDWVTIKYDEQGHMVWTAKYNGPAGYSDYASKLAADNDGNIFVAGHSNGTDTSLDLTVIKYDPTGSRQWVARYDGPSHRDDYAESLAVAPDGAVYVTGYSFGLRTEHDYITLKLGPQGERIWEARYNSPRNRDDSARALALDSQGYLYVMGTDRDPKTSYDFATIKYDPQGRRLWLARYDGGQADFEMARALYVGPRDSVYVTGYGYNRDSAYDFVTVKYATQGERLWVAEYDGGSGRIDEAVALAVDKKGSVYVAGKSFVEGSAFDCVLIKYDKDGRQVWTASYNGPGNRADVPVCLNLYGDSHIVLTGYSWGGETQRDIVVLCYGIQGELLWESRYNGPANDEDVPRAATIDSAGCILVTGYSYGSDTDYDYITLRCDPSGKLLWEARYDGGKE